MTKAREEKRRAFRGEKRVNASTETRIDPAHQPARAETHTGTSAATASSAEQPAATVQPPAVLQPSGVLQPVAAAAPALADAAEERLRKQADQLATHLRMRQREIDSRESQLNAQLAQFDRDARSARMWLTEREASLKRRSEELDQREQEIKVRTARLAAEAVQRAAGDQPPQLTKREADLAQREQALQEREARLAEQEALLLARQQAAAEQAAAAPVVDAPPTRELTAEEADTAAALGRLAEQLEGKQQDIQRAEAQLAQAVAETERLRRQLHADRERVAREAAESREQLERERRQATDEVEKLRRGVQRRSERVDRTRAALRQLRAELGKMHRETLESQLAAEELWIRMSDGAPSAALTRSLMRIRRRLSEAYRLAAAEVQTEKEELEKLRVSIAEQFEKLQEQKREIERWAVAKHEEADKHAAQLIARERELEEQHYELQEQAQRLQAERLSYHRAIRRIEVEQGNLPQSGTAS